MLLFIASALLLNFLPKPSPASAAELWRAPLKQPVLAREFRQPNSDWSAGHRGVDYLVTKAQPVFAPHDGVISFDGLVVNRSVLSIRHGNGYISSFEPVCSALKPGDSVKTGEPIGISCFTSNYVSHCLPKFCLHFSLRTENGYLSPLLALGELSPSRLKPWDGLTCSLPSSDQC